MSGEPGQILVGGRWITPIEWTPELVAELTRLWNVEKLTALAIANQLGIGRNAVIGKARRLKLDRRPNPINCTPEQMAAMVAKRMATPKRERIGNRKALTHRLSDARALAGMPRSDRSNYVPKRAPYNPQPAPIIYSKCQWIEGEPSGDDACKCRQPTVSGAYCATHAAMAWAPRNAKAMPAEAA